MTIYMSRMRNKLCLRCRCPGVHRVIGGLFAVWLVAILCLHVETDKESWIPLPQRNILAPPNNGSEDRQSPMRIDEVIEYLSSWLSQLHAHLQKHKNEKAEGIWDAYHNLTYQTLYQFDRKYLKRMPPRRSDGSIFLSVASYRDENCPDTIQEAYKHARDPHKLFVGLVQQNCHTDCLTGIMDDHKAHPTDPDVDCFQVFCREMPQICKAGQVRVLEVDEPESLGPYMARFLASKLWNGEEWYMQIDAHMTFAQNWDAISLSGLNKAPSNKPIISHYPPSHRSDLTRFQTYPSSRICGPIFTSEIIRLEGSSVYDKTKLDIPRFAPFTGAGYFVAHSSFLKEVPFDPFLPWIFMGEEIILSSRLWTSGYDIFSPAQAVVGHIYFRRHQPKFWESVHRAFTPGVHNLLEELVLERIKYQLGFPESARDMIPKSILTAVHHYSMGRARPIESYMKMIGMNATTKEVTVMKWCEKGTPPPGFEQYNQLYLT